MHTRTDRMAEISVLCAGAVKSAAHVLALQVKRDLGFDMNIAFATAPQIVKRLAAGENFDILMAPPSIIEPLIAEGRAAAESRIVVGRVGVGIAVHRAVPPPDVATVAALKRAVLAADAVVYNSASTGRYLEKLFKNIGILDILGHRLTRYAEGAEVMEHLISREGNNIGFGAITEINRYVERGLTFVGSLPAEVQNYTSYDAVLMCGATTTDTAEAALRQLATPASKAAMAAAGVV